MRKYLKYAWFLLLIPVIFIAGFVIWASTPLGPMPEALAAMQSDSTVTFEENQWYVYQPVGVTPDTGVVIYPGGRVDPRSYAPAAHAMAAQGYLVVITPMPLNLAVFAPGRAAEVIAAYPEVRSWAIGGHSLGGAMAANFAHQNPSQVMGVFLWASYPSENDDLSALDLHIVSVYGTLDGVATPETVLAAQPLLPAGTLWTAIQGGNHAQFGWYGDQPGDNPATISREEQQEQAITATLDLWGVYEK